MPIYEYQCQKCKHQFETIRKVSDEPLTTCPACGTDSLKKLVSKAAFRLKGGGWYETDFKAGKKKNVAGEDGGKPAEATSTDGAAKSGADAVKTTTESSKASKPESSD